MIRISPLDIARRGLAFAAPRATPLGRRLADPDECAKIARWLALLWIAAAGTIGALRVLLAPGSHPLVYPYVVTALLPAIALYAGYAIIRRDPGYRFSGLSVTGRWVPVSDARAKSHPLYGADGLMLMLVGGLLFSILVRAFDFYVAMPALYAGAPAWLPPMYALLFGDMLLLSAMYALCFAAALRHSPLFPALLALTWLLDIGVLGIGYLLFSGWPPLPDPVEAGLSLLLLTNVKKATISIALWAPYMLLSRRANVTFLRRVRPDDLILAR